MHSILPSDFFFKKKSRGGKHFTFILEELGSEKPFTIEL